MRACPIDRLPAAARRRLDGSRRAGRGARREAPPPPAAPPSRCSARRWILRCTTALQAAEGFDSTAGASRSDRPTSVSPTAPPGAGRVPLRSVSRRTGRRCDGDESRRRRSAGHGKRLEQASFVSVRTSTRGCAQACQGVVGVALVLPCHHALGEAAEERHLRDARGDDKRRPPRTRFTDAAARLTSASMAASRAAAVVTASSMMRALPDSLGRCAWKCPACALLMLPSNTTRPASTKALRTRTPMRNCHARWGGVNDRPRRGRAPRCETASRSPSSPAPGLLPQRAAFLTLVAVSDTWSASWSECVGRRRKDRPFAGPRAEADRGHVARQAGGVLADMLQTQVGPRLLIEMLHQSAALGEASHGNPRG